jgi:uncharacterized protein (DUF4415 family)
MAIHYRSSQTPVAVVKQTVAKPVERPSRPPQAQKPKVEPTAKPPKPALAALKATERKRGRPATEAPKVAVTLRLDPDVLAAWQADGEDWRAKMAEALRTAAPHG